MVTDRFIPPAPLNTAVLFLVFNRPESTYRVFEEIRKAKPPRLYLASDGPRKQKEGEAEKVEQIREFLIQNTDWDCEIKTLFRDKNLGCKYAVSEAISWFFRHEEQGIILEDDCLPSQSFFWFCEELLEKYKKNKRIGQISGDNYQIGRERPAADYYFSEYNQIWGWATWADRWNEYDSEMKDIESPEFISVYRNNKKEIRFWTKIFKSVKAGKIDTWDYQWTFYNWKNKWLSVIPSVNLVSNIGYGPEATHTFREHVLTALLLKELRVTDHPEVIEPSSEADAFTFKIKYAPHSLFVRLAGRLRYIYQSRIKK